MRISRSALIGGGAALGILALILDSKTALEGATEGINLCIRSVVPALFPFFVLSTILTGNLSGKGSSFIRPICKLCSVPEGGEIILITGLLGGYPVGAQSVCQLYADRRITKEESRRLLGFCNNAGPAFIFGMSSCLFQNRLAPLMLWIIHVLSALITGILLPNISTARINPSAAKTVNLAQTMQTTVRSMTFVCAWVIVFRTVLSFAKRWFLWLLPTEIQLVITGMTELTNGYLDLTMLQNERLRFILAGIFLAFGGLCVMLQTASVLVQSGLDMGFYLPGKLIQTAISAVLSYAVSGYLFHKDIRLLITASIIICSVWIFVILRKFTQIDSRNPTPSGV